MVMLQESLLSLMTRLGQSNPYFVRCIKPNVKKVSFLFETEDALRVWVHGIGKKMELAQCIL